MERRRFLALAATAGLVAAGCAPRTGDHLAADDREPSDADAPRDARPRPEPAPQQEPAPQRQPRPEAEPEVDPGLADAVPQEWGERVTGVRSRIDTDDPLVALTFDACGGARGSGYDAALIDYLRAHDVPATLFVNARWVEANAGVFDELAADPLFDIANHGTQHRPLSVDGASAYGVRGTRSIDEVVDEVLTCQRLLADRTGAAPRLFRSGTAHYDDVAVAVVEQLGLHVAGFDVLGDAGATFSAGQVEQALLGARPGSIALLHMNQPGSGTADGVAAAVPALRARGMEFTALAGRPLV